MMKYFLFGVVAILCLMILKYGITAISVLCFVIMILLSCLLIRRNLQNYLSILTKVFILLFFEICVFYPQIFIIMSNRKNPRLVKFKTIIPAENVKDILVNDSLNAIHVKEYIKGCSIDVRKNDDDNTALIQRDLSRVENVLEKVLYLSCLLILINVIVLCIC